MNGQDEWTKSLIGLIPNSGETEEFLMQDYRNHLEQKYQ